MHTTWTPPKIAILKDLWEKGYDRDDIAAHMETTRGSVVGQAFRNGMVRYMTVAERKRVDERRGHSDIPVGVKPMATPKRASKPLSEPMPELVIEMMTPEPEPEEIIPEPEAIVEPEPEPEPEKFEPEIVHPLVAEPVETLQLEPEPAPMPETLEKFPNARPLMQRTLQQCHFPVGEPARPAEQLFCCDKVIRAGEVYCSHHWNIMYPGLGKRR